MACDTPPHAPRLEDLSLFAICLPGLEGLLAEELRNLGASDPEPKPGGVACRGDLSTLHRLNLGSGLASHILIRIAVFGARSLADLDHRGARVAWERWLPRGQPVEVRARCRRSRIYHTGAAAQRIEKHLADQLGPADAEATPQVTIRVRIEDNRCTLSMDASGPPLHRRGWRQNPGRAPLREDLAHALILASGWDRESPLWDPMMGSGTILIEAASLARGLAPGRLRSFAVEQAAFHEPRILAAERQKATERARDRVPTALRGADRDPNAVAVVQANATAAGVADDLDLSTSGVSESFAAWGTDARAGAVVTNPPYGKRLDDPEALRSLYRALGQCVGKLPASWGFAMMVADRRLGARTGLDLESRFMVDSGGLKVTAMRRGATTDGGPSQPGSTPPVE